MVLKEICVVCFLVILHEAVFAVDCQSSSCLRQLYNSRVIMAEYYTRPLNSGSSSSSSGGGWWPGKKRRKRHDLHLHHAGVVVTISGTVLGKNKWLIHKGDDYGDRWDTVITDADYMGSRWSLTKTRYTRFCNLDVNDLMQAAVIGESYFELGPNCQTAANGMWNLIRNC